MLLLSKNLLNLLKLILLKKDGKINDGKSITLKVLQCIPSIIYSPLDLLKMEII